MSSVGNVIMFVQVVHSVRINGGIVVHRGSDNELVFRSEVTKVATHWQRATTIKIHHFLPVEKS
jgi:hypothetical protein